jgi:hypothetical protein
MHTRKVQIANAKIWNEAIKISVLERFYKKDMGEK